MRFSIETTYGDISAKSFRALLTKFENEKEFWERIKHFIEPNISSTQHHRYVDGNARVSIRNMLEFWEGVLAGLEGFDKSDFAEAYEKTTDWFDGHGLCPPLSTSLVGQALASLLEAGHNGTVFKILHGFVAKYDGARIQLNNNYQHDHYLTRSRSLLETIEYQFLKSSTLPAEIQRDRQISEKVSEDLGLLKEEWDMEFSRSTEAAKTLEKKVVSVVKRLHKQELLKQRSRQEAEEKAFRVRQDDEQRALEQREADFQKLKETYEAHLRLKHPAQMWSERQDEHAKNSARAWGWFIGGTIIFFLICTAFVGALGDWVADSFVRDGCVKGSEPLCKGISPKGPLIVAVTLTVLTLFLWFLRLQMKLFLSERHLSLDARERSAFAETYLSLVQQGAISGEREAVVLQSLFRPTQDGIIHDDSGPDFAVAGLLAKVLEKK